MAGEFAPSTLAPEDAPIDAKRARLSRFLGQTADGRSAVKVSDQETINHWRAALPAENARAMADLSNYAADMVAQTGLGRLAEEMFPGFPVPVVTARTAEGIL